jgi:hypothetical protein
MMIRKFLLVAVVSAVSSAVLAQGTSQQKAACRPDVRKFCHAVKEGGDFYGCLLQNRAKLRPACRAVLEGRG